MRGAVLLVVLCGGCDEEPPLPAPEVGTPEKQFIFETAHLEERREGKLLWTATARRTDGDLDRALAQDLHMVKKGDTPDQPDYDIRSPRADLLLEEGKAVFDDVRITDPGGGELTAGTARYDEHVGRIFVDGPLKFQAQGMVADAQRGEVVMNEGTVQIEGPVTGRFDPGARK